MRTLANRFQSLLNQTQRFLHDERGSFATITGVSAIAIFMCAGIAIDYSRMSMTRTAVTQALDAAVLAAGNDMLAGAQVNGAFRANFDAFLAANLEQQQISPSDITITNFVADEQSGLISAAARVQLPLTFMALSGMQSVEIDTASSAQFSNEAVEISMVLDVTGSMSGQKIAALRTAAKDAVNILLPQSGQGNTRIGLVPYSSGVNAGNLARTVTNNASNDCVTERTNTSDAYVGPGLYLGADPRADDECPALRLRGLTDNRNRLIQDLNQMQAGGYTAGHIGIAWGYYMLSDKWRPLWNNNQDPAPFGAGVRKIAIVMTDGEFNTYFAGVSGNPWGSQSARSSADALSLCDSMKALRAGEPGITIYTVAFQAPNSARNLLRQCATDNDHAFDASSETELRGAFQAIARDIQKLRLTM